MKNVALGQVPRGQLELNSVVRLWERHDTCASYSPSGVVVAGNQLLRAIGVPPQAMWTAIVPETVSGAYLGDWKSELLQEQRQTHTVFTAALILLSIGLKLRSSKFIDTGRKSKSFLPFKSLVLSLDGCGGNEASSAKSNRDRPKSSIPSHSNLLHNFTHKYKTYLNDLQMPVGYIGCFGFHFNGMASKSWALCPWLDLPLRH